MLQWKQGGLWSSTDMHSNSVSATKYVTFLCMVTAPPATCEGSLKCSNVTDTAALGNHYHPSATPHPPSLRFPKNTANGPGSLHFPSSCNHQARSPQPVPTPSVPCARWWPPPQHWGCGGQEPAPLCTTVLSTAPTGSPWTQLLR